MGYHSYESLIREIKGRLSITNLVENYVSLKRSGKGYVGLCPFHDDKNPSLHVNEDKGLYHCFACGAGGDIVGFLMRYKNVSFQDALQELAKKANIKIQNKSGASQKQSRKKSLYKVNSLVSLFYHNILISGAESRAARNYIKSRGLSMEIIKEFHLGYAPHSWETLVHFLNEKKIPQGIAENIGLIIRRKNKEGFYDRFRNRIIFPICDVDSNVVGFGGRALDRETEPKYINSPESEIYQKRSTLFGLEKSRDYVRRKEKVIIVEGYIDFLSLYSAGIRNVVATLGTSLTHEHAILLRRYTDKIIVVFDGDKSGEDASLRVLEVFLEVGISPFMVVLPSGNDPDTIIRDEGSDKFLSLTERANSLLEFYIERSLKEFKEGLITRSKAVKRIVTIIGKFKDPIEKSYYIRKTSEIFGLRESELFSLINHEIQSYDDTKSELAKKPNSQEILILKILLKFPRLSRFIKEKSVIDYITEKNIREVLEVIENKDAIDVSSLLMYFDDSSIQEIISEAIFTSDNIADESTATVMLYECLRKLKLGKLEDKLRLLRMQIEHATSNNDEVLEKKLLNEYKKCRDIVEQEKLIREEVYED